MGRNRIWRGVIALVLSTGALAGGVVATSTVAGATTPSLTCTKFFGHLNTTATIAKCGVAQSGAHFAGGDLLTGGTLTWATSKAITTFSATNTTPGQGRCAVGRVEYDVTGTVTADTSTYVAVGESVAYDICVNSTTNVVKLVHGTTGTI